MPNGAVGSYNSLPPPSQRLFKFHQPETYTFLWGQVPTLCLLAGSLLSIRLGILGLLHVFLHRVPQGGHPVPHVSHNIHQGFPGQRLLLPGFFSHVQQPLGSSPVEEFKGGIAGPHFSDGVHQVGEQLVSVLSGCLHHLPLSANMFSGMPTWKNIRTNLRAIPFEAMVRRGMASLYLVA